MLRNRGLFWHMLATLVLACVAVLVFYVCAGRAAALASALTSAVLGTLYLFASYRRYQKIAQLAEQVDRALAGDRSISFADMSEGDLAILSSEISKTLSSLSIANEDLAHEKSALADSLADISHQLRTPLTSLGLELDLLRKQSDWEHTKRILSLEHQLERIQWLVSSLLKLARLDAGTVELSRQEVNVQRLVDAAVEPLAISFELANVDFSCKIDEACSFEGDPSWTREAITNVLKNCLEHTPAGGQVSVEAHEDTLACRIHIQDTGKGFNEDDIPHIFERFWRSESDKSSDTTNPTGVGIGLSLARALINAQDGQIVASNALDAEGNVCGAAFDISFFKVLV